MRACACACLCVRVRMCCACAVCVCVRACVRRTRSTATRHALIVGTVLGSHAIPRSSAFASSCTADYRRLPRESCVPAGGPGRITVGTASHAPPAPPAHAAEAHATLRGPAALTSTDQRACTTCWRAREPAARLDVLQRQAAAAAGSGRGGAGRGGAGRGGAGRGGAGRRLCDADADSVALRGAVDRLAKHLQRRSHRPGRCTATAVRAQYAPRTALLPNLLR